MLRRSLFSAGAMLAALAALRPAAAADAGAAPKLTADDYVEIQQLYANYAHALDKGEGERFASTFVLDGEFTGGRGPGRGSEVRTPAKGKDALLKMGSRGGSRHFTANLVITPTAGGCERFGLPASLQRAKHPGDHCGNRDLRRHAGEDSAGLEVQEARGLAR